MDLNIALGLGGWIILVVGALIFGGIAQLVGDTQNPFEWLIDAIAAGLGALFTSEFIAAFQTTGPVVDGLAVVPALVGGLLVGFVVAVITRYLTGGQHTHGAMSA